MNIATKFHHLLWTNLNAVTATLCQYWSLSLSNVPNWSPMFNCLMCRMKSFFLTLEYGMIHLKSHHCDMKSLILAKSASASAYLAVGISNLPELLYVLVRQLDAIGVAHQYVLFDRDRSIPGCIGFLKQLTES